MTTTWNPSDKAAGITLSGGNLVATGASGNNKARGTSSHVTTGKFYVEFPSNTVTSGQGIIGAGEATVDLTNNSVGGCAGVDAGGNIRSDAGTASMGDTPSGKNVSLAFDFDNGKFWARLDGGAWVGNGTPGADPETNTNGLGLGTANALFLLVFIQNAGSTTMNAGSSAFTYSAPSGFLPWDDTPPPQRFTATVIN